MPNHDRKINWCRLQKVASMARRMARRKYFASLSGRQEQYPNLNVEDTISMHSDYRKYIIVRHPLQRVVSGFYEVQRKHDPEGNMKNFTQALRDYIISEAFNLHWMEFYDACHPCDIKYDAILKVETLEKDIKSLNQEFHLDSDKAFPVFHLNRDFHSTNHSKYDVILRDLERGEPELFHELLCKYDVDMKMFGYQWKGDSSVCRSGPDGCC